MSACEFSTKAVDNFVDELPDIAFFPLPARIPCQIDQNLNNLYYILFTNKLNDFFKPKKN